MSSLIVEVCKIDEVKPHTNADRLELAVIKGWQTVIGKGCHKAQDTVVYCPPDAVLPQSLSDELNVTQYLSKGRVRSTKLRGEISHGLIIPTSYITGKFKVGDNVAEKLSITKYEPPVQNNLRGTAYVAKPWRWDRILRYLFRPQWGFWKRLLIVLRRPELFGKSFLMVPSSRPECEGFNKYTDIQNYRHYANLFSTYEHNIILTEKVHGTNFRVGWVDGEFMVGSHNVNRMESKDDLYWNASKMYDLKKILKDGEVLYGEIYGKSIQKMEYGLQKTDIVFFDLKRDGVFQDWSIFKAFCIDNNLPHVPVLYIGKWYAGIEKDYGSGKTTLSGNHIREGFVIKPVTEKHDCRIGRMILKYVNDEYLAGDYGDQH